MPKKLRLVLAQLDLMVGDIQGNLKKHIEAATAARDDLKADVIIFPELSITGYPPEDLLLRKHFLDEAAAAVTEFQNTVKNIHCIIGHPYVNSHGLYNSCSLIYNGTILARYNKQHLPNYGVFDEARYFIPGNSDTVISIQDVPVGISICEDIWFPGPIHQSAALGARIIISPNASPFEINKHEQRLQVLAKRAKKNKVAIAYVNCVGGQDDLIFDGGSMVITENGEVALHAGFFQEKLLIADFEISSAETTVKHNTFTLPSEEEKIYNALVLGVRDYVHKNKFTGALIGVSGGIDSALVLAIAVDALGKENVDAIMMPSRFTADISIEDADTLVKNLGVSSQTISIEPSYESFLTSLAPAFGDKKPNVVEENIQARCRGIIIMALSNQTGRIVLSTGNRSEMATGYCTLYGDMAGGFAVLKDIPKTMVYRLSNYRNSIQHVIPQRIIDRPPTAELAFDQKDQDTLPPYPILDEILELHLNEAQGLEEIVAKGFDRETVKRVIKLVKISEHKRRQSPPGIRINHTAFGRDRRYPITSGS